MNYEDKQTIKNIIDDILDTYCLNDNVKRELYKILNILEG